MPNFHPIVWFLAGAIFVIVLFLLTGDLQLGSDHR